MKDLRREVVVTGMGAVTPFGIGVDVLWDGVSNARSAIDWIQLLPDLDTTAYPVRYAGELRGFSVDEHLKQHCEVRLERSVQMGLVASREALQQARLLDATDKILNSATQIDTILGSAAGACCELEVGYWNFYQRGPRAVHPKTVPKGMFNALSSNVSIYFGSTGQNLVIASACASGASAIGMAATLIRHGYADIVLAGGAESSFTPAHLTFWTNLGVLAKHSDPQKASRPFDRQRNGLVLGEGAATVVMESRESAEKRGSVPLAVFRGFGRSSDAFHITSPTVAGQRLAIESSLADAGLQPSEIDYINAHGTGTKANDETESQAIVEVFGPRGSSMPVSSTKSMLGHSLGASGAIEFIVSIEAIRHGFVPPTINCDEPDPDLGLDFVPNIGRPFTTRFAMSNSFGFGGNNVVLLVETAL